MKIDLKECIRQIEEGGYSNEAGDLKNLVAFVKLKEIIEANNSTLDIAEITQKEMENYMRRMRVESGWIYNFWNDEKKDFNQEWVFVPRLK